MTNDNRNTPRPKAWKDQTRGVRDGRVQKLRKQLAVPPDGTALDAAERRMVEASLPTPGAPSIINLDAADRFREAAEPILDRWLKREREAEEKRNQEHRRAHAAAADAVTPRRTMPRAKLKLQFSDDIRSLFTEASFEDRAAAVADRHAPLVHGDGSVRHSADLPTPQARGDVAWLASRLGDRVKQHAGEADEVYEQRRAECIKASFTDLTKAVLELRVCAERWPRAEHVALLAVALLRVPTPATLGDLEARVAGLHNLRQARTKRRRASEEA